MITISWNFIAAYCLLSFIIGAMLTWNLFGAENSWGAQKRAKATIEKFRTNACINIGLAIHRKLVYYERAFCSSKVADVAPKREADAYFKGMNDAIIELHDFKPEESSQLKERD